MKNLGAWVGNLIEKRENCLISIFHRPRRCLRLVEREDGASKSVQDTVVMNIFGEDSMMNQGCIIVLR